MKNKIITVVKVALVLIVCLVIILPFLKRQSLKLTESNYIEKFVKLEDYDILRNYEDSSAQINLSVSNQGDMLLSSLFLDIIYLDDAREILEKDRIDLLTMTNDVIVAGAIKTFTIDVTYPQETEFIELEVKY
ncbi:MAG: hypothetical protein KJ593_04305 [Candidatus Omnitrophica bacterium]|nr:hypothetical protein [Candidatus Omnitrophota bacterium]